MREKGVFERIAPIFNGVWWKSDIYPTCE